VRSFGTETYRRNDLDSIRGPPTGGPLLFTIDWEPPAYPSSTVGSISGFRPVAFRKCLRTG
jgi:hypothetical protein